MTENEITVEQESIVISGAEATDVTINGVSIVEDNVANINTKGEYNAESNKIATENDIPDVSNFITKDANDLTYYTLATDTGHSIELSINSSTYVVTLNLKNSAGTTISTDSIDLPLESVVVNGSYDSENKKIVLTLQSGTTIDIPVGDLVSGLQSEITSNNKLSSDLVDDTNNTNLFVTSGEKTTWNGKQDPITVTTSSSSTYTIASLTGNNTYKLGEITSLTITVATTFDDETSIYFTSGSTATSISIPDTLVNIGDAPTFTASGGVNTGTCEASKNYIVSICNNVAIWKNY